MKSIKLLTTMTLSDKDYGYLLAVCTDGSVWTRIFPEARGDTWRQIEGINDGPIGVASEIESGGCNG